MESTLIGNVARAMASRGPDGTGTWVSGSVALGRCLLRTTPDSTEQAGPLTDRDGQSVIVWDGRLDNREELIAALSDLEQGQGTDSELVLAAFQRWGAETPTRLLGDFAFAVWDARNQRLFCARDHVGARPLFYVKNEHLFAFASEEEALLGLPGVSNRPNELLIADVFAMCSASYDDQGSWLESVRELLPAHAVEATPSGSWRYWRYWRLEAGDELVFGSDREALEAFLDVFGQAVRARLRGTQDVAAMMSGGLDSAGISAMVKRILREEPGRAFHTYSALSDQPEACLESQCIQSLTRDLGERAHVVGVPSLQGMAGLADLLEVAWSRAHPIDNSLLVQALVCLAGGRQGHRVLLHGASGDVVTGANNRHYAASFLADGKWRRAWRECSGASRNHVFLKERSPVWLLLRAAASAYSPPWLKWTIRSLRRRPFDYAARSLQPDFVQRLSLDARRETILAQCHRRGRSRSARADALASPWGLVLGLTAYDRFAGRFGVALRDPWADRRVVEFFLNLPLRLKVRDGWTKHMTRKAFELDLEPVVRERRDKENLGWQFTQRVMDCSHGVIVSTLADDAGVASGYLDLSAVRARYDRYRASRDVEEGEFLYEAVTLIQWLTRLSKAPSL